MRSESTALSILPVVSSKVTGVGKTTGDDGTISVPHKASWSVGKWQRNALFFPPVKSVSCGSGLCVPGGRDASFSSARYLLA